MHIQIQITKPYIMEEVASILASPLDDLLPVGAVGSLLMQQSPELVLAACEKHNVPFCQVSLECVVEPQPRSAAPAGTTLGYEGEHLAKDDILAAECMSDPAKPVARKLLRGPLDSQSQLCRS